MAGNETTTKTRPIDIIWLDPLPNHDHRIVLFKGKTIGFSPLDSDEIRLTSCYKCKKENYALAVMDGVCAWCGWSVEELDQ